MISSLPITIGLLQMYGNYCIIFHSKCKIDLIFL